MRPTANQDTSRGPGLIGSKPQISTLSAHHLPGGGSALGVRVFTPGLGCPRAAWAIPSIGKMWGDWDFIITSASLRAQGPQGRAECVCFYPPAVGAACEAPASWLSG